MENSNYKFIVVCRDNELYDYAYRQVNNFKNTYFDNHYSLNKMLDFIQKVHCSSKINAIINLPFKSYWIKKRINFYVQKLNEMPSNYKNTCIILFADCLQLEKMGLSRYLRKMIPGIKIVYYFQDLVATEKTKLDFLNNDRKLADLIYSFDNNDAEQYGMLFHNIPYSLPQEDGMSSECKYDVCFVGKAKNRLDDILEVHNQLKKKGLKTLFYIVDVPVEKQINGDGIIYGKQISYGNYLKIVKQSKCILEIMQKGGSGNTIRVNEAIAYDKLLLSDNKYLLQNTLYDSKYMRVFESTDDIDVSFINDIQHVEYSNKQKMLPEEFLKDVEKHLDKRGM